MTHRPVVVALRALGLGDFLTAIPALKGLSSYLPGHQVVLAAPPGLAPLARLSGAVHAVLPAQPLRPLPTAPGPGPPALAVNLHGRGPQSHQILLDLHPRQLLAYRSPSVRQTRGGPVWRQAEHEVDRWCRLLAHAGIPADRRALGLPRPDRRVPETWTGATLIHPGAASAARRWPAERFAAVARREADQGHTVLVTGGPHEAPLAHRVARLAGLPSSVVVAGATDLLDLAALVASAGRVVCGDTGVAHLASAYATPSVVLFGPVPPARWGPPAFPRHGVLWAGTTGDPHGDHPDPGLLQIGVPDVLGELDRLRGLETMAMPTGSARRYERHDHLAVRRSD